MLWRTLPYRIATLLVVAALIVAAVVIAVLRPSQGGAAGSPSISVLSGPTVPLPAFLAQNQDLQAKLAQPVQAHLAYEQAGKQYLVASGVDDTVCLLVVTLADQAANSTCQAKDVSEKQSIFIILPNHDQTLDLAGVVADGFTAASAGGRAAPVQRNVYVIEHAHPFTYFHLEGRGNPRDIELDTTHIRFP